MGQTAKDRKAMDKLEQSREFLVDASKVDIVEYSDIDRIVLNEQPKRVKKCYGDEEALSIKGNAIKEGFTYPIKISWFLSIEGLDWTVFYFWLIKDWSWNGLRATYPGIISGSISIILSLYEIWTATRLRYWTILWNRIGILLWLLANFCWMVGDFGFLNLITDPEEGQAHAERSLLFAQWFNLAATIWLILYWICFKWIVRHFRWEEDNEHMLYDRRFLPAAPLGTSLFDSFRDFENVHALFWAAKDCAWVWGYPFIYYPCYSFTIFLTGHMMMTYARSKNGFVHLFHSVAQAIWLIANLSWATGELLFESGYLDPTWDDGDIYALVAFQWPNVPENKFLYPRYVAQWIFCGSFAAVLIGLSSWTLATYRKWSRFEREKLKSVSNTVL